MAHRQHNDLYGYHDHHIDADYDNDNDHDDHDHDDQDQEMDDVPTTTGGSTPVKRKRLTQACDPCRKKKIKCDGIRPSCANCAKLDLPCTYLPSMKKRGPRQGYIELLEKRLDKMEKMLQNNPAAIDPELLDPKLSNIERRSADGEGEGSPTVPKPSSDTRYFGGTSALSHYRESEKLTHPMIHSHGHSGKPDPKRPIYGIKDEIPRKDILDHLIELFFDSVYFQFPVIHPGSFMKQYKEGKVHANLLNAICAGVARFSTHPDVVTTPSFLAGEPFATNVRASLVDSIDIPTVSNVQALLFLAMYEYGAARGPRAWMFGGMAIRMAQELGLNREDSSPVFYLKGDWVLRETRRRTFWACFIMDVLASSSSGRPRMIDERDCEVLLPSEDNAWHEARPVVTEMLDGDQDPNLADPSKEHAEEQKQEPHAAKEHSWSDPSTMDDKTHLPSDGSREPFEEPSKGHRLSTFAYLIRILAVLGKVSQYVNRPRTKKAIPPNEPGSEFSIIDAALKAWLQSIPPRYAYAHNNADMLKVKSEGSIIIFMYVIYHTSVVLLHRPIIAADKASFPMDSNFVDNSIARCAEAASKVSEVLEFVSRQKYPPQVYISSFFAYPVFTTATIHITNAFASDPVMAAKARRNLSTHVKILQTMKSYWAMADKFFYIIRDLYSIQSKISSSSASGGIIVPQVVSHNAHGCSRNYAADSEVEALKAKKDRARNGNDDETKRERLEGDEPPPRMVVKSKLASISSFLKSDSGLIALWRRATEMQVIDEANQQKRRIATAEEPSKVQHTGVQDEEAKDTDYMTQRKQRELMNKLEIQEINQEFERQWKAKLLEEQRQKAQGEKGEESQPQSMEKRQTEGDEAGNPRASKQARIAKTATPSSPVQYLSAHSPGSSSGSLTGSSTRSPSEQNQTLLATQPTSGSDDNITYRHGLLQRPEQLQQLQARDTYMMQPMLTNPPVASAPGAPANANVNHLMKVYNQQHQQQEAIAQALDVRQNTNIQHQQQQLQQQRQQASASSSLAFGPPGGFSTGFLSSSNASSIPQQPQQTLGHFQQQSSTLTGPGFGPPLVYGSSFSHDQSRGQADLTDSIFDFAMPLGDLNFLSSSFQLTPMMMEQSGNNMVMDPVRVMPGSNATSNTPLNSLSAISQQATGPGSVDSGMSPVPTSPATSTSSVNFLMSNLEARGPDRSVHGRALSESKSPQSTQNISPGLNSLLMSDEAFADMQSTPDSLVRYLQIYHQQQQQQAIQLQQQNMQPLLNQQNSLIYDDYFQWSQLLPASSGFNAAASTSASSTSASIPAAAAAPATMGSIQHQKQQQQQSSQSQALSSADIDNMLTSIPSFS
ncbi:fungal-specific transcription factor domain-containing protein [Mortierella sp. GBAus27b]|nr:hypothetical protein BGX31_006772 [Mortierella sp. GBA43]KAI8354702.1 fungal-specific transcription factor domain-containing protein [Mortierella sp. GBAus27b]